ncbi:hypothetical protein [Helicobacter cetorum]|uniref:Uncharacterized protein n=1 Tax=Helicobacter cetorum (strain ATCC BAA-429 / MIT 00-7128) TaxID=182217 RepID=I0EL59_HELC0|nr:hypothetical protein [Helicobacter cetorum]AFI03678.1 hypothetical protein HCW_01965 [Helicobacter cetorum MIT 00-7128]
MALFGLGGWEHGNNQIAKFLNEIKVNGMVAIKVGQGLVALVQVIGGAYDIRKYAHYSVPKIEHDWLIYRIPVRVLDWANSGESIPQGRGTLNKCVNPSAETSQIILKWYEKVCVKLKEKGE